LLLDKGASVNATNRDGNTPLHIAAFLCNEEIVRLLLQRGANPSLKNKRGETAVDVVRGAWGPELSQVYENLDRERELALDIPSLPRRRAAMLVMLEKSGK
jgi:hypothetical protein